MARKPTVAELQQQVRGLQCYQELAYLLLTADEPVRVEWECYHYADHDNAEPVRYAVDLYGLTRASGGIAVDVETQCASYVSDYRARLRDEPSAYARDAERKIGRLQDAACARGQAEAEQRRAARRSA